MSERSDPVPDTAPADDAEGVDAFRLELLSDLPALLDKAVRTYSRFSMSPPPDDAKGFVAYQTGCRAALAHVHLLVKLAHWARSAAVASEDPALQADQLERLVQEAEAALRSDAPEDDDAAALPD